MTTRFLQDIIRQRTEMRRTIDYLMGPGHAALEQASSLIRTARDVFITGIGASWNAALSAGTLFDLGGRPVHMQEAGELLHFTVIPSGLFSCLPKQKQVARPSSASRIRLTVHSHGSLR